MDQRAAQARNERTAGLALLAATLFWGCGFTWAKSAGEAVQDAAGLPHEASFGPVFLLGCRFLLAAVVWFLIFPASRKGWTIRGLCRAIGVGVLLGAGLIVQHVGLDRTSEAVSAFLTSLTILFVPLLMIVAMRPPRAVLWLGVVVAAAGVWLMTGAQPQGFGLGELLGLACAFLFSLYILAVNAAAAHDTPWRMSPGQFLVVALMCFITCAVLPGGAQNLRPSAVVHILSQRTVWTNLLLLSSFTTIMAFGLLTHFQPRIDPTRAALIYLAEPVVATAYAAFAAGHRVGTKSLVGAGLILVANVLIEVLSAWGTRASPEPVVLVD